MIMINAIVLLFSFYFVGFYTGYNISKYKLCKTMHDMVDNVPNDADNEFIKGVLYVCKSLHKIM